MEEADEEGKAADTRDRANDEVKGEADRRAAGARRGRAVEKARDRETWSDEVEGKEGRKEGQLGRQWNPLDPTPMHIRPRAEEPRSHPSKAQAGSNAVHRPPSMPNGYLDDGQRGSCACE